MKPSTRSSLLITYLLNSDSENTFPNKPSASPLKQTVPLYLADILLYSCEADYILKLIKDKRITEDKAFILTSKYINDVLSINNSNFGHWSPIKYPHIIRRNNRNSFPVSFPDIYLIYDTNGQFST